LWTQEGGNRELWSLCECGSRAGLMGRAFVVVYA